MLLDLQIFDDQTKYHTLAEIEKILKRRGKSLRSYHLMSYPDLSLLDEGRNRLIQDELSYDRLMLKEEYKTFGHP